MATKCHNGPNERNFHIVGRYPPIINVLGVVDSRPQPLVWACVVVPPSDGPASGLSGTSPPPSCELFMDLQIWYATVMRPVCGLFGLVRHGRVTCLWTYG